MSVCVWAWGKHRSWDCGVLLRIIITLLLHYYYYAEYYTGWNITYNISRTFLYLFNKVITRVFTESSIKYIHNLTLSTIMSNSMRDTLTIITSHHYLNHAPARHVAILLIKLKSRPLTYPNTLSLEHIKTRPLDTPHGTSILRRHRYTLVLTLLNTTTDTLSPALPLPLQLPLPLPQPLPLSQPKPLPPILTYPFQY